jgi:hypothetical protein
VVVSRGFALDPAAASDRGYRLRLIAEMLSRRFAFEQRYVGIHH